MSKTPRTIQVSSYGPTGLGKFTVRVPTGTRSLAAIIKSVERRTHLTVCGQYNQGVSRNRDGSPAFQHYSPQLGARSLVGDYTSAGEIWVAIPVTGAGGAA